MTKEKSDAAPARGRKPTYGAVMKRKHIHFPTDMWEYLSSKGDASAYVRQLVSNDMAGPSTTPPQT